MRLSEAATGGDELERAMPNWHIGLYSTSLLMCQTVSILSALIDKSYCWHYIANVPKGACSFQLGLMKI